MAILVWDMKAVGENLFAQRSCWELKQPTGTDLSQKILNLIWSLNSQATHMAMLLHPHNACFSLAMVYTCTIILLHWLVLTPMHCMFSDSHFVDFIYG